MKKDYITPELSIVKLHLTVDILNISDGENTGSGGSGTGGEFGPSSDIIDDL